MQIATNPNTISVTALVPSRLFSMSRLVRHWANNFAILRSWSVEVVFIREVLVRIRTTYCLPQHT